MGSTGLHPRGDAYPADAQDLESYRQAEALLDELRTPVLLHADDPHERLYIASLDGTGNSLFDDEPENWSVAAKVYLQVHDIKTQGITNIAGGYVEGTFTQNGLLRGPARLWDGRFAHTFDERVETAYYQLCEQAKKWLEEDPHAQIRVVGIGFSRGAEEVAALQRLIHERGIRDPTDARVRKNEEGLIVGIEYDDRPLLVQPGRTLQAALLFDPVATGVEDEDRRLPSSTMSVFQISAEDEKRDPFKVNDHVPPGFSEDYRNLNVIVGGAHSDIGNTYERNGLGVRSFNLGVEFLNRLSDRPFLHRQPVPEDPRMSVVHRSELGMWGLYRTSGFDRDGVRDRLEDQSPLPGIQRKDPISEELDALVERRTGGTHATTAQTRDEDTPTHSAAPLGDSRSPADDLLDRALAAYLADDGRRFSQVMDEYRRTPDGVAWERQQSEFVRSLREQEAMDQAQRLATCTVEPAVPHAPVMRM